MAIFLHTAAASDRISQAAAVNLRALAATADPATHITAAANYSTLLPIAVEAIATSERISHTATEKNLRALADPGRVMPLPPSQLLPIAPTPPPKVPEAADTVMHVDAAFLCTPPATPCYNGNNQPSYP